MAFKSKVNIPDDAIRGFRAMLSLDSEKLASFIKALRTISLSLDRNELVKSITDSVDVSPEDTESILGIIMGITVVSGNDKTDFPSLVDTVINTLHQNKKLEINNDSDWDQLKDNLIALLNADSPITLNAKIIDLMAAYQHSYCDRDSRVVTDIRPAFADDLTDGRVATAIIHNLKICYHQDNSHKEFYVALTEQDLDQLIKILTRAKTKADRLRNMITIKDSPFSYLDTRKSE